MTTYFVEIFDDAIVAAEGWPVGVEVVADYDPVVEILSPGPQGIPGPATTTDPSTGANFAVLANGGKYIYTQPTQPVMQNGDIWIPTPL